MRHTRRMFRKAFGCDLSHVFIDFPSIPIASGAVAQVGIGERETSLYEMDDLTFSFWRMCGVSLQVYKAKLRTPINGITDVAVKVRHPYVKEHIARDLALLQGFARFVEWVWDAPWFQLSANVKNFAARLSVVPIMFSTSCSDFLSFFFPKNLKDECTM